MRKNDDDDDDDQEWQKKRLKLVNIGKKSVNHSFPNSFCYYNNEMILMMMKKILEFICERSSYILKLL